MTGTFGAFPLAAGVACIDDGRPVARDKGDMGVAANAGIDHLAHDLLKGMSE